MRNTNAIPVRVRGVDYPSASVAARALGVPRWHVVKALDRGIGETLGLVPLPSRIKTVPVSVNGVAYTSISAAARAHGTIPYHLLFMALDGALDVKLIRETPNGNESGS